MKNISPRQLAIFISIIASVATTTGAAAVLFFKDTHFFVPAIFLGLAVFFLIYLLVFYSLNGFIIRRIRPIYKTIQNISKDDAKLMDKVEDRDIIQDVQNDVMRWVNKKTREISLLRQQERYRREFIGDVSHELKTPIFNIQGYILTLLDGGLEDKTINRKYLERAEKSVNRMISIVNDLESISRLESGELKLQYKNFNIAKLVDEVFEEYERMAREGKITLRTRYIPDKPVMVRADRKRIQEVLNNLVGNSVKYGKKGGSTTIDFLDMEDAVMVDVTDDGIGISERDLPRIFDRFFRTDKSRSREKGGTGLGLSIVKHIIEAHNQTINVQSELGKGSSFSFTLRKA